jgi:uncharacterized protein (TIGR03435 family)
MNSSMKKIILLIIAIIASSGNVLFAQNITGTWQGTLAQPSVKGQRIVLKLSKDDGQLKATLYFIDQSGQPFNATFVKLVNSTLRVEFTSGNYEGTLSADGKSIAGTVSFGASQPLNLTRATNEMAWEIPAPSSPLKPMADDADPSFEVATIKPDDSGASIMQELGMDGRHFIARNASLGDLIESAYMVQAKQIEGGPAWMDKSRYDIAAIPDQEGTPDPQQVKSMIRKLLTDRFGLKFHQDKRDLAAFVLMVGKNGQTLTPTQSKGPQPYYGIAPGKGGLSLRIANGTMAGLSSFLQLFVLDRPVVDQTGLTGKFDFSLTFTPDDSEFNGHPPQMRKSADDVEAAPGLFEAIQQQLGLKLEAKKTPVDVIVIDQVQKPSSN